ncbi:protein kinase domain-containing protein [Cordyceps fumosorosea ARSEF 2679]|uniref:Protein kinase domain-containing protein n=1 Tax=Cordyceps fumosorosea (strain ARSEF 2679) TaxID=1081104 RepID=A0A167N3F8_CORFA|nr:protein kinase domain-containing protein [Cordyceps fumosorosea ARSEF 2679]OAA55086.1 protein kinase domain-containing protein [Cordyceps fumosorosea ARSEF 2679]
MLHAIADTGILESFGKEDMAIPSPPKYVDGAPVYKSRHFGLPDDFGRIVLSNFGEMVQGDVKRKHNAQPDVYRSPEVTLKAAWSYPIDTWNVGAMMCLLIPKRTLFAASRSLFYLKGPVLSLRTL